MEQPADFLHQWGPIGGFVAGIILLLCGRTLFWFFVAVVGFLFGLQFGAQLLPGGDQSAILALSLVLGLACAVLAIFLQKALVILAGAAAGGLLAMQYATAAGWGEPFSVVAFLLAAIVAGLLIAFVFEWALIVLSSWMGASLIAQVLPLQDRMEALVVLGLLLLGMVVQGRFRPPAPVTT